MISILIVGAFVLIILLAVMSGDEETFFACLGIFGFITAVSVVILSQAAVHTDASIEREKTSLYEREGTTLGLYNTSEGIVFAYHIKSFDGRIVEEAIAQKEAKVTIHPIKADESPFIVERRIDEHEDTDKAAFPWDWVGKHHTYISYAFYVPEGTVVGPMKMEENSGSRDETEIEQSEKQLETKSQSARLQAESANEETG